MVLEIRVMQINKIMLQSIMMGIFLSVLQEISLQKIVKG
ncbi:hypothetical protein HMPREF9699_01900 [Bergeyella zoohelcum ATCC 43767]|uniref:Uncharacterized protein n=1 Tax=Bergeyella zoohelcum ATCC 43767 TaxID=883096 RepID=K1LF84_9FLAO|nr:hypothetical protein HMPREF9699_01900 [Bergeyella zoohelcum ATCC 43767]